MNYEKARVFILDKLRMELPPNLYYHSVGHTIDVCDAVERLGQLEGVSGEELILLKTAALYHDSGFLKQYLSNEPAGVELACTTLVQFGFTEKHLEVIGAIIMATQIPQKSNNLLEEVMCDADLDYLGRADFHPIADGLRRELHDRAIINSDKQWDEIQIAFLSKHCYFTSTANQLRNEKKQQNLAEVKHRYDNNLY
jgi:predicted metal-dependent HD superfamily phosphohydrolase